jgi:alpha-beta hydrolase superfamily lysophospholipase
MLGSTYDRTSKTNKPPVVYCHGLGADPGQITGTNGQPATGKLLTTIAEAGYPIVANNHAALWGASPSDTRVDEAVTFARTTLGAHPTKRPFIIGGSMGAATALHWAKAVGPNGVAGVIAIIPALDLEAIRTANTLSARAGIDAAWGVTWISDRVVALPAGANAYDNTSNYLVIDGILFVATDDAVSAGYSTFATNTKFQLVTVGALGHTDAAIAAVDVQQVLRFMQPRS